MKFTTLLPLVDNEGASLAAEVKRAIASLSLQFGGVTIEGTVDGRWVDDGVEYRDRSKKVSVVCDNSRYDEARSRVIEIGRELRQLAMYFEVRMDDGIEILRIE